MSAGVPGATWTQGSSGDDDDDEDDDDDGMQKSWQILTSSQLSSHKKSQLARLVESGKYEETLCRESSGQQMTVVGGIIERPKTGESAIEEQLESEMETAWGKMADGMWK